MAKLLLVRKVESKSNYTSGVLYIAKNNQAATMNGRRIMFTQQCDTLEPKWRDLKKQQKVKGQTAIPEGEYKIVMSPSSKFHRNMPYLKNVPQFEGIMIHPGNTVKDTMGCILVGTKNSSGLANSRATFEKIMKILNSEDENTIEIIDTYVI